MTRPTKHNPERGDARRRLLDAAVHEVRLRGFTATSVDAICSRAGVSKGAYFHHFDNKEDVGIASAAHWSEVTSQIFQSAPYQEVENPAEKIIAYVDFRRELIQGGLSDFSCLAGTMVQETFDSYPDIRDACGESILGHAKTLEEDISQAMQDADLETDWTAFGLATHIQAVIQGAFVVAKAANDPSVAQESLEHLKRYLKLLFNV